MSAFGEAAPAFRKAEFRSDIQALRAVSVAAVLIFHLWPAALTGGYVGVDVFFVISGFLIGSQLLREIESTGNINLLMFWKRRIRRLQPAALLVLAFSLIGTVLWAPRGAWVSWLQEIIASVLQLQNWLLGYNAVDYLAAGDEKSPVQHYWTLSVEEQFYVLFPLLLLAVIRLAKHLRGHALITISLSLILTVLISLAYSLWHTATSPSMAYFNTFARAWEFACGALLALYPRRPSALAGSVAVPLGLLLIVASSFAFDSGTAFPGSAALLPVTGAMLCLWAGPGSTLQRLGSVRLVATLGRCSYSVYLWHWPLIILAPWALMHWPFNLVSPYIGDNGRPVVIAFLSVLLGWLSTTFVEDPMRYSGVHLSRHNRKRFTAAGACALALLCAAFTVALQGEPSDEAITDEQHAHVMSLPIDALPPCFGASAMDPDNNGCRNTGLGQSVFPVASRIAKDDANRQECWNHAGRTSTNICALGPESGYVKQVLAIGDSHNTTLIEAYEYIARRNNWRIDVSSHEGCYLTAAKQTRPDKIQWDMCLGWRTYMLQRAKTLPYDAFIVTHTRSSGLEVREEGKTLQETIVDGLVEAWSALPNKPIIAIVDNPGIGRGKTIRTCYWREARPSDIIANCSLDRDTALVSDGQAEAAYRLENVKTVDLTHLYCNETTCPALIGNVLVYRDDNHITRTFAKTLAPYLNREIVLALSALESSSERPNSRSGVNPADE